jgi:hypothetical protein
LSISFQVYSRTLSGDSIPLSEDGSLGFSYTLVTCYRPFSWFCISPCPSGGEEWLGALGDVQYGIRRLAVIGII